MADETGFPKTESVSGSEIQGIVGGRDVKLEENLALLGSRDSLLGGKMTLADAVAAGLVDSSSGLFTDPTNGQEMSLSQAIFQGLLDPSNAVVMTTDGAMTLQDAVNQGLVDLENGLVKNPNNGQWIPLESAIRNGHILPTIKSQSLDELIQQGLYDVDTGLVHDPVTGRNVPLVQAIEESLVDKKSVVIKDPTTGCLMNLVEASEKGIVDPDSSYNEKSLVDAVRKGLEGNKQHDSDTVHSENNIDETCQAAPNNIPEQQANGPKESSTEEKDSRQSEPISIVKAIVQGFYDPSSNVVQDPRSGFVLTIQQALEEGVVSTCGVYARDPESEQEMTFRMAVDMDCIDLEAGTVNFDNENPIKLEDAVLDGTIYEKELPQIPIALKKAIDEGYYNEDSGLFFDPRTEDSLNLNDALVRKLIDPFSMVVNDPNSCEVMSLEEAMDAEMINSETSMVLDSVSNELVALPEAVRRTILIPRPMSIATAVNIGLYNEAIGKFLDPTCRQFFTLSEAMQVGLLDNGSMVVDPATGRVLSLAMATACGVLDANNGNVINVHTGEVISLKDAISSKDIIVPRPSESEGFSLQDAISKGLYDNENGQMTDPATGESHSLADALARGLIDANSYILNPSSNERISLADAIQEGILNVANGRLKNSQSGEEVPINSQLVGHNLSLQDIINNGLYDASDNTVTNPLTGEKVTLKEAIESGIVDLQSVIEDPSSGQKLTLQEVIDNGVINLQSGQLEDENTGTKVSLNELFSGDNKIPSAEYSLEQIMNMGIYDPETNTVTNPLTEEVMSLQEAIEGGLIDLTSVVKDPRTGGNLTLSDAIESGVFDPNMGIFIDTHSGNEFSLIEALEADIITSPEDREFANEDLLQSEDEIKQVKNNLLSSGLVDVENDSLISMTNTCNGTNNLTNENEHDDDTVDIPLVGLSHVKVQDPFTGSLLSIDEASRRRLFNPETNMLLDTETGISVDLQEALDKGLAKISEDASEINMTDDSFVTGKDKDKPVKTGDNGDNLRAMKRYDGVSDLVEIDDLKYPLENNSINEGENSEGFVPLSLNDIFEKGLFNEDTGCITDPHTGRKFTIQEAIDIGLLDPDSIRVKDPETNALLNYDEAVARGVLNPSNGDIRSADGEELTLKEAVRGGVALLAQDVKALSLELAVEQGICNPDSGMVTDPKTGEEISLLEAIARGIIDPMSSRIRDPHSGEELSLEEAAENGLIDLVKGEVEDPFTGKKLTLGQAMLTNVLVPVKVEPCSLGEAIDSKMFVEELGRIKEPTLGTYKTVSDGIDMGLIDRNKTLFKDPKCGKLIPLDDAIEGGLFNNDEGKAIDPSCGDLVGVQEALERGIIVDVVRPALLSVPEAVDLGLIDEQDNKIHHPFSGQKLNLSDAVNVKLISDDDTFVQNTATGEFVPLSKALQDNLVNGTTGRVHDLEQGRQIGLVTAAGEGLIIDVNVLQGGVDLSSQTTAGDIESCVDVMPIVCGEDVKLFNLDNNGQPQHQDTSPVSFALPPSQQPNAEQDSAQVEWTIYLI